MNGCCCCQGSSFCPCPLWLSFFSLLGQNTSSVSGSGYASVARCRASCEKMSRDAQNCKQGRKLPLPLQPGAAMAQPLHLVSHQFKPKYSSLLWSSTLNYPFLSSCSVALVLWPPASSKLMVNWSQTVKWMVLQLLITLQYLLLFCAGNLLQYCCSVLMCLQV